MNPENPCKNKRKVSDNLLQFTAMHISEFVSLLSKLHRHRAKPSGNCSISNIFVDCECDRNNAN
jgi:hypothetical protein